MKSVLLLLAIAALGYGIVWWLFSAHEAGSKSRRDSGAAPDDGRTAGNGAGPEADAGPRPWHEVLGVAESASNEEIRAAWRRLMSQYHPDKVAGLGPELRDLAEARSREINAAYDYITSWRGGA